MYKIPLFTNLTGGYDDRPSCYIAEIILGEERNMDKKYRTLVTLIEHELFGEPNLPAFLYWFDESVRGYHR